MSRRKPPAATLADADVPGDVLERLGRVTPELRRAKDAISRGEAVDTETPERLESYTRREELRQHRETILSASQVTAALDPLRERVVGSDDILRIGFLARGMLAARAVGRLVVMGGTEHGTGFLAAPDMLITNNHVLPDPDRAHATEIEFEVHDQAGAVAEVRMCELSPARFWFTDKELDVTIVALADTPAARACTEGLGWHPMIGQQGKIRIGDPVNIIQHPQGRQKSIVLHNSNLLHLENDSELSPFLWYSSDTEPGSSGAPVFSNHWEVIGVHHRSVPKTNSAGELVDAKGAVIPRDEFLRNPNRAVWIANQGARTSQIVKALAAATFPHATHEHARNHLLQLWEGSRLRNEGQAAALRSLQPDPTTEAVRSSGAFAAAPGVTIHITVERTG